MGRVTAIANAYTTGYPAPGSTSNRPATAASAAAEAAELALAATAAAAAAAPLPPWRSDAAPARQDAPDAAPPVEAKESVGVSATGDETDTTAVLAGAEAGALAAAGLEAGEAAADGSGDGGVNLSDQGGPQPRGVEQPTGRSAASATRAEPAGTSADKPEEPSTTSGGTSRVGAFGGYGAAGGELAPPGDKLTLSQLQTVKIEVCVHAVCVRTCSLSVMCAGCCWLAVCARPAPSPPFLCPSNPYLTTIQAPSRPKMISYV
jgi:hypothetical protein